MKIIAIPKNLKELKQHLNEPLFKNAYFLMLSSITGAGSGFFFWLIAARYYSTEEIGIASAIISAMGLITLLSLLGFDVSLVRFLPERENKKELINSVLTISLVVSLTLAIVFIAGLRFLSPSLSIMRENKILLTLFLIFTTVAPLSSLLSSGVFVAFRKTKYSFFQTLVTLVRIGIVPLLVGYGALGIYASFGLTPILAFLLGISLISKIIVYKPRIELNKHILNIFGYSFGNYFAKIFEYLPTFVLPLMVINILGVEANAYFFIAWQISMLLFAIPRFTSMSLLAESSHKPEELEKNTKRAVKFITLLLGAAIMGIFLGGRYFLWMFGKGYSEKSFYILLILSLSSIPFAFNALYAMIKRVQKEIKPVIFVYGLSALISIIGGFIAMPKIGLIGVGIAWLAGQGITTVVEILMMRYSLRDMLNYLLSIV